MQVYWLGGSLLVDYMLTVAVSVSAGAEAIISAIPALYGHQVAISIGIVILITLMNLRGLRESASFLMLPVYSFIAIITLLIVVGLFKIVTGAQPLNATAFTRSRGSRNFYCLSFTGVFHLVLLP